MMITNTAKHALAQLILLTAFTTFAGCTSIATTPQRIDQYLNQQAPEQVLQGKPARILDGDTLDLLSNSQILRIRLKGIDAPEKTQAFGLEAKAYLTRLVSNQDLIITWSSKDKYGRIIGKIRIARTNSDVCLKMIESGLAWHYKQFANQQTDDDRVLYAEAEEKARAARQGLWQDDNPLPPWDYRHQQKDSIPMSDKSNNNGGGAKSAPSDDELVDRTIRDMQETTLFKALTDLELIRTARDSDVLADDPTVFELISRLNPAWQTDLSDVDSLSLPSYVAIAVPLQVAKSAISSDHCRCVSAGNLDPHLQPCIYCALKQAVFKNTRDELYRPDPDDFHS